MVRLGSAEFCGIPQERRKSGSCVYFSDASGWLATMELREELRPDAAQTVAQLRAAGVSVHILSGDAALAVQRVAEQAGIGNAVGDLQPEQKLAHLRALQAKGHRVAMVGDGLNDGPVIAGADVSFAFGNAAPLAQARADFVVQGDQLASVATVLLLSRRTLRVVRQNLWWALIYNLACVPLAVLGLLPAWLAGLGMAGSSLLVVLNALRLSHFAARPAAQE
jgi:Cu2+-exporting ATPase